MKYYIISGEASGDLHGSKLIEALKKKDNRAHIRCWGGDLMKKSGGELIKHYKELAFMGFWEVIIHLKTILSNIKFCKKDILAFNPDVIIYIDYPGFNLRISKWAKKKGFKNHFYISPQVWAWKENRVHQMKRDLDALYVILPFEKEFFEKKHQFPVKYVCHPMLDWVTLKKKPTGFLNKNQLSETKPLIALLPGSRRQEIKKILPIYLSVTKYFRQYEFVIAGAPGIELKEYSFFIKKDEFKDTKLILDVSNRFFNDRIGVLGQIDLENRNRSSNELGTTYNLMGEQLDSVNTLTLESLNLNDIIRINDRENRLFVFDVNIPNGNISYSNLNSTIDKDITCLLYTSPSPRDRG